MVCSCCVTRHRFCDFLGGNLVYGTFPPPILSPGPPGTAWSSAGAWVPCLLSSAASRSGQTLLLFFTPLGLLPRHKNRASGRPRPPPSPTDLLFIILPPARSLPRFFLEAYDASLGPCHGCFHHRSRCSQNRCCTTPRRLRRGRRPSRGFLASRRGAASVFAPCAPSPRSAGGHPALPPGEFLVLPPRVTFPLPRTASPTSPQARPRETSRGRESSMKMPRPSLPTRQQPCHQRPAGIRALQGWQPPGRPHAQSRS